MEALVRSQRVPRPCALTNTAVAPVSHGHERGPGTRRENRIEIGVGGASLPAR